MEWHKVSAMIRISDMDLHCTIFSVLIFDWHSMKQCHSGESILQIQAVWSELSFRHVQSTNTSET